MAFQLGYAGGFADVGVELPDQPVPVASSGAGGGMLVRRRWTATPIQAPKPVAATVRAHLTIDYRLTGRVVAVRRTAVSLPSAPEAEIRRAAITVTTRAAVNITTKAASTVTVDQKALSRFAAEMRELGELAVALTLWD